MKSTIAIDYIKTEYGRRLSSSFGVIHRDRAGGHVFALHYPTKKWLVWTEANGTQHYVSEHEKYAVANADFFGRVKASAAAA